MSIFSVPTRILSGEAAFEQLKAYAITRACIICDPFVAKSGLLNKLLKVLAEMGANHRIFSDIRPDPDTDLVVEGLQQILEHKPDAVIAVGGGSAIDARQGHQLPISEKHRRSKASVRGGSHHQRHRQRGHQFRRYHRQGHPH